MIRFVSFLCLVGLIGCASSPPAEEPQDVTMRHTLTDDDRKIPAPNMTPPHKNPEVSQGEDSSVEVVDLAPGRTHIAQGGVQITLLNVTDRQIELGFKKGEDVLEVVHDGRYAEGHAFGLVYSADVADTVYFRLEAREGAGPIDLTSAGEIAAREIRERVDCEGAEAMQSVAQTNGTVLIRAMKGESVVCSVRVGLYTRAVVANEPITEIPKDLRPASEL